MQHSRALRFTHASQQLLWFLLPEHSPLALALALELPECWCSKAVNLLSTLRHLFDIQPKFALHHW